MKKLLTVFLILGILVFAIDSHADTDVDVDSNSAVDAIYGGTNRDTSGDTGFPYITAGVWAVSAVDLTEFEELKTIGATTISANQWAALGALAETLTGTEINILDGGLSAGDIPSIHSSQEIDSPSKSFTINAATTADDFLLWRTNVAITITDIYGVLQSGTNVVGGLDECDSAGANPVAVDAEITFDGGLDQDDGSLTNGGIDAGDWIRWHTTTVSAPGYLTLTINYTID